MATITDLPTEILLHIFRYYLETEEQKKLVKIIANVCLNWKNICLNSYLWTKYDGSLSFKEMMNLCKTGCLSNTKELIVSSTANLKDSYVHELFSGVPNVESIDFSKVEQLSKNTLSVMARNCTKLKEIQIGYQSKTPVKLNYETLSPFFAARGCEIVKINLSYCHIINFPLSIRCISDCCPNLEYLHLMNIVCRAGAFPTKYFQMHCPKLKVLYLDQNIRISSNRHSTGFPDLEVFTYLDCEGNTVTDRDVECVLFDSPKLKFLNLTNCDISATLLCSLPACSVECLFISRSKVCNTNALSDVLRKWSHSLKEVDLSHGTNYAVNKGIFYLVTTPEQSPLEYLNLNFTKIIVVMIEEVLLNCTLLEVLKVEGCRNLARGMKKSYSGRKEFADLSAKIKEFKSAHPELVETIDIC